MWQTFPLWPTQASAMSHQVDALFIVLIAITGGVTLLVFAVMAFFIFKYRHDKHPQPEPIEGSLPLEFAWSIIPLGIFMVFFVWGASIYFAEARPPKDALEIYVVAKQWMWKMEHQDGQSEINSLHVPVNRPVRLTMISQDVIHSFFIPDFRLKTDVLPGRYTTEWFTAVKPGHYHLFCSQYCGTQHSGMIGEVVAMDPADYQAWLTGTGAQGSLAQNGQTLFQQLGCSTCHRFDVPGRGPNLQGVYGGPVLLADGRTIIADDSYLREHILTPGVRVMAGFQNIMPSFKGILSEEQVLALIAYIKSLSPPAPAGSPGAISPAVTTEAGSPAVGRGTGNPVGGTARAPEK